MTHRPVAVAVALAACALIAGCAPAPSAPWAAPEPQEAAAAPETGPEEAVQEEAETEGSGAQDVEETPVETAASGNDGSSGEAAAEPAGDDAPGDGTEAPTEEGDVPPVAIATDLRPSLDHGPKPAANQRYIVLHDTEGTAGPAEVVDWWDSTGTYVAAHFVVGRDGSVVQCVGLDSIAHHAGYGDAGHNELFAIEEDGRDDMRGSSPIGSWAPDYAMNAWSVGIELVHTGGQDYPEAQLGALDALVAHIDSHFGFESEIVDHKAWRSGNSDTSPEFATYLENYRTHRTHDGN